MKQNPLNIPRHASRSALRAAAVLVGIVYAAAAGSGNLSSAPLSVKGTVPPNVMLSLSVEFPTAVTAAYRGNVTDDPFVGTGAGETSTDYASTTEYLGYFDPGKCYTYSSTDTGNSITYTTIPAADSNNGRFNPASITANRECSGQWSGNFLNYATMTSIDVFRFAMTGGMRSIDTTTATVLERVRIDNQGSTNNFPDKKLTGSVLDNATPLGNGTRYFRTGDNGISLTYASGYNSTGPSGCNPNNGPPPGGAVKTDTTTCVRTLNGSVGTVFIRVKVCDSSVGLEENCRAYGTSPVIYKPAGVVQDNAERQKFGVFSYFASEKTDNAVMRSKAKFTGPTKFSSSGYVTNSNTEWSATTGIFTNNPDPSETSATTYANSGVVNYVNKFGLFTQVTQRQDAASRYKVFDNVGRLYYETLAYLRGRQPTNDTGSGHGTFYAGATAANSDNFPIITTWDDPIQYSCQKNFIIFVGDTNSCCDKRFPGSTFTTNTNSGGNGGNNWPTTLTPPGSGTTATLDTMTTSGDLLYDSINFKTYIDAIGTLEGRTLSSAGNSSFWIAGAASWAKTQDIRPDDSTKAWTIGTQSVTSYMIDIWEFGDKKAAAGDESHFWLAAKYGGFKDSNGTNTPDQTSEWRVSDSKYIGGTNGNTAGVRPKNLLPAGDPRSMIDSIRAAVADINAQILDESALAQSTGDLRTTGGAFIFRSTFNSGNWTGDVNAFAVSAAGASTTPSWSAQTQVEATADTARKILTYNDGRLANGTMGTGTLNRRGVGFVWADLSPLQQDKLNRDGVGFLDSDGSARLTYLRGSRTNETPAGKLYRKRDKLLGDIVNSSPVYVGNSPDQNILDASYNVFTGSLVLAGTTTYKNRLQVVYTGANDGMLHGFNAGPTGTLGAPLISYVPAAVYNKLSLLTAGNYVHQYYVDGGPTAGDACLSTCPSDGTGWRTMLTGGMNAGGKGIYALNITNPGAFAEPAAGAASSQVMWEFTSRDDADLGYTYGKPLIRKMNNGKWAVIFGNGYNNSVAVSGDTVCTGGTGTTASPFTPANCTTSPTGRAYLYIAFVDGPGAGTAWTQATHYYKIMAGATAATTYGTTAAPNGLGAPFAVDTNLDGTTDVIYAGDQKGNIWKFDVSSVTPASWGASFSNVPLFTATSDTGVAQPITSQLTGTRHPNGGMLIMFGTGSFIEDGDVATTGLQSIYAIWDQLIDNTTTVPTDYRTSKKLQRQKIVLTVQVGGEDFFALSNCKVNYSGAMTSTGAPTGAFDCPSAIAVTGTPAVKQYGWYFDLYNVDSSGTETKLGERFVADRPLLQAGLLTFPTLSPALDPCTGNTAGRRFDVDFLTGGRTDQVIFDTNNDGVANSSDMGSYTVGSVTTNIVLSGKFTAGGAADTPVRFTLPAPPIPPPSTASTSVTATGACTNFIAGWGCSGSSIAGINSSARTYVLDLTAKELATTSAVVNGMKIFLPGSSGRLGWRQIIQR